MPELSDTDHAPIEAANTGIVRFTGLVGIYGNTVIIDHGLGLYSGYWHQSQIAVRVGQHVQPGDLIGHIGDTGLVTGPHLGAFNNRTSLPELNEATAASVAACLAARHHASGGRW